jgi:hypothetical protein
MTCPADISVNNTTGTCGAVVTYTTLLELIQLFWCNHYTKQQAWLGATFQLDNHYHIQKVTDAAGFTNPCSFSSNTVTVDNKYLQFVQLIFPVNNTTGTCGAVVTYTVSVGTDNCSGATTTQTKVWLPCNPPSWGNH